MSNSAFHSLPMLTLTLLAGLLIYAPLKLAALPISAPDLSACHLPYYLPEGELYLNCCAPVPSTEPVEFKMPENVTVRVRRPAHKQGVEYAEKLSRAYELMRALPPEDPRSFVQQANIHCAYCNGVYYEPNGTTSLEIHSSWLFFPFHRWYLYFHERILVKLLQDDGVDVDGDGDGNASFALSYWNYDHHDGASMPAIFVDYAELNCSLREPRHTRPPSVVILDYPLVLDNYTELPAPVQLDVNDNIMYYVMVSGAATQFAFFGEPMRSGDDPAPGHGTAEMSPHNTVHGYVGDYNTLGWKNMGSLYAAARDPVFYAHHAGLDRLWDVWKSLNPDTNTDIQDPDYLDSAFSFYDENADLVHVKVRDSFNSTALGFVYEESELPWLESKPAAASSSVATAADVAVFCQLDGAVLSETCSVVVDRPDSSDTASSDLLQPRSSRQVEVLAIRGIEATMSGDGGQARFDVFVNLPSANATTRLDVTEYAGTFSSMPQLRHMVSSSGVGSPMRSSLRLASIPFIVSELNLSQQRSLVVTLVPRPGAQISVASVALEMEETPASSA